MVYKICDITKAIRIILDQNATSEQLILSGDIDTLSLNEIIGSKICDATRTVEMNTPAYLLDSGCNFGEAVYWESLCSGWTILPDDFMRLIAFKMDDWERAVYTAMADSDPGYARQSSRWKGLRGTPQRPMCAIMMKPVGRVLEFYSCKSEEAAVEQAVYLPLPKEENGGIEISERCYNAILYYAAGLVAQTLGLETATAMFEISKSLIV